MTLIATGVSPLRRHSALFVAMALFMAPLVVNSAEKEKEPPPPTDLPTVHAVADQWTSSDIFGRWPLFLDLTSPKILDADTALEQETDDRQDPCDPDKPGTQSQGNPVVLYTGNKVEVETDFAAVGEMPLQLQRVYNHHWSAGGLFGNHWLSSFDYSLAFSDANNIAWAQRPDGRRIKFLLDTASGRWYEDRAQPVAYITRLADGSYSLYNDERGTETYSASGYITLRRNEQGVYWSFAYNGTYLQSVTHSSGRSVQFGWSGDQLAQITDPAGNVYQYTYTANAFGTGRARLASSQLPGIPATTVQYHYEDARYPGALTGKSFNGVRYSTFAYDGQRRAISTEHSGGIERFVFDYNVQSTQQVMAPPAPPRPGGLLPVDEQYSCGTRQFDSIYCNAARSASSARGATAGATASATSATRTRAVKTSVAVTNPLGRRTVYAFEDGRQISVAGDQSPRCAASYKELTYDSNGYPDVMSDFNGVLTDFDYDAQGRLIKTVEAADTPLARTTTQVWNTDHRLTKQTTAGAAEVEYTYDARGNITLTQTRNLTQYGTANQVRATTVAYTYHANGLKASVKVDGPLANDDVTYVFNSMGDLVSVTNGLGHQTTYANYNAMGLPGKITGPNGDVQEATYDGRGRIITQRRSTGSGWATTTLAYDGAGNIASVTAPTGAVTRYQYDAGRRLLKQVSPLADGTYAWTQHSYDTASNVVRTEVRHTDYPLDSVVTGIIDGITHDGQWNWSISGWACATGHASSIAVDIYAEGGVYLNTVTANRAADASIAGACQTGHSNHAFSYVVPLSQRQQFGGKTFSVYGRSPQGDAANRLLVNSGAFQIPSAHIIGNIDGVTSDGNGNHFINGWACMIGMSSSIPVHMYVGGPAGSGSFADAGMADRPAEIEVSNACQTTGAAHRFSLPLDANLRAVHSGKAIYIHGIAPEGSANLVINGSGTSTVPAIVNAAAITAFTTGQQQVISGTRVTLTVNVQNTGNTVWQPGQVVLNLGQGAPNAARALTQAVPPGGSTVFSVQVAPTSTLPGIRPVTYHAQMASNGAGFGPVATLSISVEARGTTCPPTRPNCTGPLRVEEAGALESTEGDL